MIYVVRLQKVCIKCQLAHPFYVYVFWETWDIKYFSSHLNKYSQTNFRKTVRGEWPLRIQKEKLYKSSFYSDKVVCGMACSRLIHKVTAALAICLQVGAER